MFHGTNICNNTLNIFTDSLAECFLKRGIDVGFINYNSQNESLADQYVREINKGFDVAIAFNSYGYHETDIGDINVFNYLKVPFYNWIVDHPNEHTDFLISNVNNYNIICIDRNHVQYVKQHFPNIKDVFFIPLGGKRYMENFDFSFGAYSKREFNVTLCGSLGSLTKYESLISQLPENINRIVCDVIDQMLSNSSICYEEALNKVLLEKKITFDKDDFLELSPILGLANQYVRQYFRKESISALLTNGLSIDIFGEGWDEFKNTRAKIHGSISYEETLKVTANSKISLNILPAFKDGLHDRIPTAMMNGALVATDFSKYMHECFISDGENNMLIEIEDFKAAADNISDVLKNLESAYHSAMCGKSYADANFTWDNRACELLNLISLKA